MNTNLLTFDGQDMATQDALAAYAIRPLLIEEDGQCDCSAEALTARASTITLVLEDILSKGYAFPHGAINE